MVLNFAGAPLVFQNGAWAASLPRIAVFDDAFVAANVCSGIAIETTHRQNLHELILGAQGVALKAALQGHVSRIEDHNRNLRVKGDAIPAAARGTLTVDAFCALAADPRHGLARRQKDPDTEGGLLPAAHFIYYRALAEAIAAAPENSMRRVTTAVRSEPVAMPNTGWTMRPARSRPI